MYFFIGYICYYDIILASLGGSQMSTNNEDLQKHFAPFRQHIVGDSEKFLSPYGYQSIRYFDWAASGRLYQPIEERMLHFIGPLVGNTHTESNVTGTAMSQLYHHAKSLIKNHVNASTEDCILFDGTGMTDAIRHLQRILGLVVDESHQKILDIEESSRPVVFITQMEHHSNHTSWLETICEVVLISSDSDGTVDMDAFEKQIKNHSNRPIIASITACSNVTGVITPYHEIAQLIHRYNGICIVDFSTSAPYVQIDMHPDQERHLDAILFSPHKFLGGPGTTGVCIFHSSLYRKQVPDRPGGGTVLWTNPWGGRQYFSSIEEREDGGTPGFLQAIRTAYAIQLKEQMGMEEINAQEQVLLNYLLDHMDKIPNISIIANKKSHRLGIVSFYSSSIHHNLLVRLLNDRYGIQVRGGCSCAGTYGHVLFQIDKQASKIIADQLDQGNLIVKPGWVRISLHPTTTIEDIDYFLNALRDITEQINLYKKDYMYHHQYQDFVHRSFKYHFQELIHLPKVNELSTESGKIY
jgi:selenocysteine lyase/cysteine desulfurase